MVLPADGQHGDQLMRAARLLQAHAPIDDLGAATPGDWLAEVAESENWRFPDCYAVGTSACAGVPRPLAPASVAELERHVASVRPDLRCTPAARESMAYLLDPPGLDEEAAAFWQDVRDAAIAVLPEWARQMYGYGPPQPLTPGRRIEIRQSLGVLDAMFLSQPGVLEARQRITVRMRAGRSA